MGAILSYQFKDSLSRRFHCNFRCSVRFALSFLYVFNTFPYSMHFAHTTEASRDYETVTRTLTFMNSTEQIVPVPIIADDRTESVESFTAMLMSPTPSGSAFITAPTATINIIDQQGIYIPSAAR